MWGRPCTPLLFLGASVFLLVNYMVSEPWIFAADVLVILIGIPIYWFWTRRSGPERPAA